MKTQSRQHFSNKYKTCTVVTSPVFIGSKVLSEIDFNPRKKKKKKKKIVYDKISNGRFTNSRRYRIELNWINSFQLNGKNQVVFSFNQRPVFIKQFNTYNGLFLLTRPGNVSHYSIFNNYLKKKQIHNKTHTHGGFKKRVRNYWRY